MSTVTREHDGRQGGVPWQIALWAAQILLFMAYGASGVMNSFASVDSLMAMGMTHAGVLPYWLLRFLGISELAGTLGIILPALTRIKPVLTPLAALGFTAIQLLAIGFHMARGELAQMAPINLTLLGLSLFVLWGRLKMAPVAPRS
jgi:uncharacterized membrane protein YphA (DoxX/SURF4 family)